MPQSIVDLWASGVDRLNGEVDNFTSQLLFPYIQSIKNYKWVKPQEKYVFDSLWGNIHFSPPEVLLLDSPIIQRLRYIGQLGLAQTLFSGATHSRFEHTMGVTHIAGRMAERIKESLQKEQFPSDADEFKSIHGLEIFPLVRLAALFHDVGHMFCSHASESFFSDPSFSGNKKVKILLKSFREKLNVTPDLGEMLSCLILTSPSMIELLTLAMHYYGAHNLSQEDAAARAAGHAACLILGTPWNEKLLPYICIINGSIDADKCDYLSRDSQKTGIPVAVDTNRIISQLTVAPRAVDPDAGAIGVINRLSDSDKEAIPAIMPSAVRNIDDVAISRMLMFEKVYTHQKVVSIENLFRKALRLIDEACPTFFENFGENLRITDNDLITPNVKKFLYHKAGIREGSNKELELLDSAALILDNIYYRRLLKRCCAIDEKSIQPVTVLNDDSLVRSLDAMISVEANSKTRDDLCDEICAELGRILETLENAAPKDAHRYYGILTAPYPTKGNKTVTFHIKYDDEIEDYKTRFNLNTWQEGRFNLIKRHFFLAPEQYLVEAYIAVRKVLYEKGFYLSSSAYKQCKISTTDYKKKVRALSKKGYFDSYPALNHVEFSDYPKRRIEMWLEDEFSSYSGANGYKVKSKTQVFGFILQFLPYRKNTTLSEEDFLKTLFAVLLQVKCIERAKFGEFFTELYERIESQFADFLIDRLYCLGSQSDSSSHIAYYWNDVLAKLKETNKPLFTIESLGALERDLSLQGSNKALVFYDDAFATGTQVISIFQQLIGIPPKDRASKAEHAYTLSQESIDILKSREIYILYCYGNDEDAQNVKKTLARYGLKIECICAKQFPSSLFDPSRYDQSISADHLTQIKVVYSQIGEKLLRARKCINSIWDKGWDEKKATSYSLGYGGREQGVVFAWNTPSYTLTPLWCQGTEDFPWNPLFPRQDKFQQFPQSL
ncbi:HD domain-containing protein [Desulfovibrio sp. OttesenSCG-928-G11]|nr:HD domain-containing protein [Desulfovibrio sp. OttesenSCG-928-G11]